MPKQFSAREENGDEIIIFIEHGVLDSTLKRDQRQGYGQNRLPGLRTEDGRYVNYISKGRYEIVDEEANIPVSSDDPNAP